MGHSGTSLTIGIVFTSLYVLLLSHITIVLRVAILPPQICLAYRLLGFSVIALPLCAVSYSNW